MPSAAVLHSTSGHSSRYSQTNTPLPCPPEGLHNLDHYIPSFEDVPRNRVVDEIAFTDTPVSPRKRSRTQTPLSDEDAAEFQEGGRKTNNSKVTSS